MSSVIVKTKIRKIKIDKNIEYCNIKVTDKLPPWKICAQLDTHFKRVDVWTNDNAKFAKHGVPEKLITFEGVQINFIDKEYYPLSGIEWMVYNRASINMTPLKAKNHLERHKIAFTAKRFGI